MTTARAPSVVQAKAAKKVRNVKAVPFVELYGQRLQGVVSSGSDEDRVYVCFIEVGSGNYACTTNNNRPCGGGGFCKHLSWLLEQAVEQYGGERVARAMRITGDITPEITAAEIRAQLRGQPVRADAANVFSRFLGYLRFVELQGSNAPMPEMAWFVMG
jgi:hypothetical protein